MPQGVWVQDLKSANWGDVEKLCLNILQTQSKDLQVVAWLLEAWMSLYSMKGLKQGFDLLLQMSQKYWDTAFPQLNPQDPEFRSAPYNWINERLSNRFNKIEVTAPDDPDLLTYSYSTYLDLQKDGGIVITGSSEEQNLSEKRTGFAKSLKKTKDDFFVGLKADGEETLTLIKNLQSFLDSKFGADGPSLYHAQDKIQEFINFFEQTLAARHQPQENVSVKLEAGEEEENASSSENTPPAANTNVHVDMVMNSRSDAYALINQAADYLEKLDPHSPSPHLIKRAIRWSNLDLKNLLQEMIKDPSSLEDLKHLLGMAQETNTSETGDALSGPQSTDPSS
ncbi:MAG TPA: type VI secretion system protein TssA [Holosporales bacterium]|nr:type VI secretion system protein TssA [Holosporales bacterium]